MEYDYKVMWHGRLFRLIEQCKGEEGLCKKCVWRNKPNKENKSEYSPCIRPFGFPSCPKINGLWHNDPSAIWKDVTLDIEKPQGEFMNTKIKKYLLLLLLVITATYFGNFVIEELWYPIQNDVTMAQLNGGDAEMIANRSMIQFKNDGSFWFSMIGSFCSGYLLGGIVIQIFLTTRSNKNE